MTLSIFTGLFALLSLCLCSRHVQGVDPDNVLVDKGRAILYVQPISVKNVGKYDQQGKQCYRNCTVNVRMCLLYHPDPLLPEWQNASLCQHVGAVGEHWDVALRHPNANHRYWKLVWYSATKEILVPNFKDQNHKFLSIWFDGTQQEVVDDPRTNFTRIEHRLIAQNYTVLFVRNLLMPGEAKKQFKMVAPVNFKKDLENPPPYRGQLELVIKMWTKCDDFYFGCKCGIYCFDTEQHKCDRNGQKVCNINWHWNTDKKDCSSFCKPYGDGMYCDESAKKKCYPGYYHEGEEGPSSQDPCKKKICQTHNKCQKEGKTCVTTIHQFNKETDGFFKCVQS